MGFLGGQSPPTCLKIESDSMSASYFFLGARSTGSTGAGAVDESAEGSSGFSARRRSSVSMREASSSLRFLSAAFSVKKASSLVISSLISWFVDTADGIADADGVAVSVANAVEVVVAVEVIEAGEVPDAVEVTDTVEVAGVDVDTVAPCWAFAAVAVFCEGVFLPLPCVMLLRHRKERNRKIKKKLALEGHPTPSRVN